MTIADEGPDDTAGHEAELVYFWRPGCPFCMMLERDLERSGIEVSKRNIWDDPDAAAAVRSLADGNETVPTVQLGERALVNPSIEAVTALLREFAPGLLPDG